MKLPRARRKAGIASTVFGLRPDVLACCVCAGILGAALLFGGGGKRGQSLRIDDIAGNQAGAVALRGPAHDLQSPMGTLRLRLAFAVNGSAVYTLESREHGPIVLVSSMSILRRAQPAADFSPWRVLATERTHVDTTWRPLWGERALVVDRYNGLTLALARLSSGGVPEAHLEIRAYDEGVAFRFLLTGTSLAAGVIGDRHEFSMPAGAQAFWSWSAQKTYTKVDLESAWPKPCEPPLTMQLPGANSSIGVGGNRSIDGGPWVSLLEAAQVNFPHMRLALQGANRLVTVLDGEASVPSAPFAMPWRVIMVADKPGQLLEHNYLVLNLNPPNALADTSWIKPGRVMRSMSLKTLPLLEQIDFAVERDIEYLHLDAGWYGNEYDPASDATKWNASMVDLPRVISYAKWKKRGIILYVNHLALERQMDELFPLYRKWGVDGVKFGFVNVGPQNWTVWLHDAIKKAADHKLIVDVHDDYRPTGFSRTYPHLLQVEGIYGDEGMPSANQSTIYPFTRFVAGHADHTYCFLDAHMTKTKAHQLALTVINFGPLQFLSWYDTPGRYKGKMDEIEFWKDLPTVWDDTKVLDAEPGEFVVVARRRGHDWWIGAVTNESERSVAVPLDFLAADAGFEAHIHEDGEDGSVMHRLVDLSRESILSLAMRASGGVAVRLRCRRLAR
jgi:alpha-glucosidase